MKRNHVPNSRLTYIANYIETAVPRYDIKQSDPLLAAQEGVGNCVSKAVVAGILLERNGWEGGVLPALAWNRNTHPQKHQDLLGRVGLRNGHAMLLSTSNADDGTIAYLAFNPLAQQADSWEIDDFNSLDADATTEGGVIVPTPVGLAAGYVIEEWHSGGKKYLEALGIMDSAYHLTTREEMSGLVVASLIERDLLTDLTSI